jgi:autotransporter-associated beta strand protein
MTRNLVAFGAAIALFAGPACGQTWTGAANDGNWNNATNWNPATIPNSTTADAVFGDTGVGSISLSSSVSDRSLTFNNSSGGYTLTSAAATMSNLSSITVGPAVSGNDTINLANVSTGSLLLSGTLTITNNSASSATSLTIGPNTVIGNPLSGGIVVTGPGTTAFLGSFGSGSNFINGGLTKSGPGTLSMYGDGTNLRGGLDLAGGYLQLNFTSNTAAKLLAGPLVSTGGTLMIVPNASTGVTQNFTTTTLNAGDTEYNVNGSGMLPSLGLAGVTRAPGTTFSLTGNNGTFLTTTTGNTNGIWGNGPAFASAFGTYWFTNNSNFLVELAAGPTNTFSSGTNTDVSGSVSPSAFTTNSLRFNTADTFLGLTGTNTLQSGGILVTPNAAPSYIYGGALNSGQNELIVHAYSDFTIFSSIVASAGLTKTGPNTLTLAGNNSSLFGPININRGSLTITTTAAVNNASSISFNDNRGSTFQYFTIDLGSGISGTVSAPIQFAAYSNHAAGGGFANIISTGLSENSQVTLNGVISSAPGAVTPIFFYGTTTNSSGFNLTATNTFTGDIELNQGSLGINSNASLGNPANTLILDVGTTSGGLNFLNSGITVARPVVIANPTTIASNNGDVNTISGPVSGNFGFYKDGTGTLVLAGTNTQPGLAITAGTVRVAADANIGSTGGSIFINNGATLAVTGTIANVRNIIIGPFSGDVPGTATIDVASGQLFTQQGSITGSFGGLIKTSAGELIINSTNNTYGGGTTIQQGTVLVAADSSLGAAGTPVTVGVAGLLIYNASTSTSRTFFNSGTVTASTGVTVTLNGANVYGGFLRGFGTFALTNGASLTGNSTFNTLSTTLTGTGSYVNFSNGGNLTITAGSGNFATFNGFINQGSGAITAGAQSTILATDFQTYGTLTVNPATVTENFSQTTKMTNFGASQLYFNGGSRTFLGTPGTAVFPSNWPDVALRGTPTFVAGIDLNGKNATVAGGLFVNNGYVEDTTNGGAGSATVVADFGSLVKGAGFFQNTVITQNGGKYQAGNSPGVASFGKFVLGPGGVSSYVFAIDDATGEAGPSPDAAGHVSGWGLVKAIVHDTGVATTPGDFTWTATPAEKLLVSLQTLMNPTTVGLDVPGMMDHFDPMHSYSWPAVTWTGSYAGPTDTATLDAATAFDVSGFANPIGGLFGWALDIGGQTLSLTYTPSAVPEPGSLALLAATAGAALVARKRRPGRG